VQTVDDVQTETV